MNRRLAEIVGEMERARVLLKESVTGLSQQAFDAKPQADGWSIGEVLHHLFLVEKQVVKLLTRQIERARQQGVGPDVGTESLLSNLDAFSIETAGRRMRAPESAAPQHGLARNQLLSDLAHSREAMLQAADEAGAYDLTQLVFPHPAFGRMNMYEWLLFVSKHERRHTAQIWNIRAGLQEGEGSAGA